MKSQFKSRTAKRVGVLTSGGDCPGLNAVIRGVVKSACQLGYETVGFLKGYEGLVDPVSYISLNNKNTSGILTQGGTILGSTNKGRFAATSGVSDRLELEPDLLEAVRTTVDQLDLAGLICVGGDGSLKIAQQFDEFGIPVVGVPKTIDNDLSATAFTFGFDSAVACATDALDRLHTTACSHERIMVLEVMGRHAGWIALHSGIAGGASMVLIPEQPFDIEDVCARVKTRFQSKYAPIIVVSEGAMPRDGGEMTLVSGEKDAFGHVRLGGIGDRLASEIESRTGAEARAVVLGHIQRGGTPTAFDRWLATRFGLQAIDAVAEGDFGTMMALRGTKIERLKLIEGTGELKLVSPAEYAEAQVFFG